MDFFWIYYSENIGYHRQDSVWDKHLPASINGKIRKSLTKKKKKCEIFYTLGSDPYPQECENSRRVECRYPLTVMG